MKTGQIPFLMRQVTIKGKSNEELFGLIQKAIASGQFIQLISTVRLDALKQPYYYIGLRRDVYELDFKLSVNDQIAAFLLAYVRGNEILPEVTDFTITPIEDPEQWMFTHRCETSKYAQSYKEELSSAGDIHYLSEKFVFPRGRISYPSLKVENILDLIMAG